MTCPTCGAIVDQHAPVCQLCGTAVQSATGTTPDAPASEARSADPAQPAWPGGAPAAGSTGAPGPSGGQAWATGAAGGPTPPPPPPAPGAAGWGVPQPHPSGLSSELRGWAIGAHLGGLVVGLATAAVFGFAGPLLVWLFKREEHRFLDHHAKEALNFQLTVLLVVVLSVVLAIPAALVGVLTLGVGFIALAILAVVAAVAWIVLPIIGAVKASNGEGYRYPFTIRFIA